MGEVKVVKSVSVIARELLEDLVEASKPIFPDCKIYSDVWAGTIYEVIARKSFFRRAAVFTIAADHKNNGLAVNVTHPLLFEAAQRAVAKYAGQLEEITLIKDYSERRAPPSYRPASA